MGFARRPGAHIHPVSRPEALDEYVGKWVAVKDGEVIAFADNTRELVYRVRSMDRRKTAGAVAQFVPPPDSAYMVGVG